MSPPCRGRETKKKKRKKKKEKTKPGSRRCLNEVGSFSPLFPSRRGLIFLIFLTLHSPTLSTASTHQALTKSRPINVSSGRWLASSKETSLSTRRIRAPKLRPDNAAIITSRKSPHLVPSASWPLFGPSRRLGCPVDDVSSLRHQTHSPDSPDSPVTTIHPSGPRRLFRLTKRLPPTPRCAASTARICTRKR